MPINLPKPTDVIKVKAIAESAMFYKHTTLGMLRIDSCDEDRFHCHDENNEIRCGLMMIVMYSEVDLTKDKFFKLTEIN